ncbi:hypothetical protein HU200_028432 [Digitaria exilis]|uniref:Peroxidase n=1 Tax=Digitaria exilis TaxID=1010633 RepID=A0A835BVA5_9POAL|nr:hypothetical protein HU200_028432 [Digitaria exilis]
MSAQQMMKSFAATVLAGSGVAALSPDYYAMTCPFVEYTVRSVVADALMKDPTLAGSLLRLHFHDCFVQGCDASVLIDSTDDNKAEKDAGANKSLRGFEVIDRVKEAVESHCPGIVSCADILALVARDAVAMARGPYYFVPLGRRDGTRSVASDTFTTLPPPLGNVTLLAQMFAGVGLDLKDMVALSGGHTLGIAHCANFKARVQNELDTLDATLATSLGSVCSKGGDAGTAPFDRTSTRFDAVYYRELQAKRGLLSSDQVLFEDPATKDMVNAFSMNPYYFFQAFQQGMLKMGQINLKEGDEGEIRLNCRVPNP